MYLGQRQQVLHLSFGICRAFPDSKVYVAITRPTWGRQNPCGTHIWVMLELLGYVFFVDSHNAFSPQFSNKCS